MKKSKVVNKISSNPLVSIVIPLHWGLKRENYKRFLKDLEIYFDQDYKKIEVIIITDKKVNLPSLFDKFRTLNVGHKTVSPALKKDFALKYIKGEICAFIDDDAYPAKDWISNAVKDFKRYNVVAVGGPGITPPDDSFWQKIGGYIIESYFCSGGVQYRYYNGIKKKQFVNDYPAYNFLVRTDILKLVKGHDSKFYGGEDTYLCMKLSKIGDILYDSDVVAYHHRRSFPLGHLKQIANVGLHRGYFFKKYPETSRHIFYLQPTLLTIGLSLWILISLFTPHIVGILLAISFLIFLIIGTLSVMSHKVKIIPSFIAGFGIIATHIVYGIYFLKGLLISDLNN